MPHFAFYRNDKVKIKCFKLFKNSQKFYYLQISLTNIYFLSFSFSNFRLKPNSGFYLLYGIFINKTYIIS